MRYTTRDELIEDIKQAREHLDDLLLRVGGLPEDLNDASAPELWGASVHALLAKHACENIDSDLTRRYQAIGGDEKVLWESQATPSEATGGHKQ